MKIKVNNKEKIMPEGINITKLINLLNYSDTIGLALAINEEVIPKSKWDNTIIKEGESIIIIQATCGG